MNGTTAHVLAELDRYRTGELEPTHRRRVEEHLATCSDCARELARLESFATTLAKGFAAARGLETREPDWDRQRRAILERTALVLRSRPTRPVGLWRYTPQAALAVLALIVLGVLYREGVRGPAEAERRLREDVLSESRDVEEAPPPPPRQEAAAGADERAFTGEGQAGGERKNALEAPPPPDDLRAEAENERAAAAPEPVETQENHRGVAPEAPAEAGREKAEVADDDFAGAPEEAPAAAAPEAGPRRDRAALEDRAAKTKETALAGQDELQRFDLLARRALANADSLEGTQALAFWRDSLATRTDLDPARKRAAAALADSLSQIFGSTPARREAGAS